MEEKIKNVTLSFCCKKEWNSLATVDERTRFCRSCKHKVIDFTNSSQKELDEAMKNQVGVCGRFNRSQMSEAFVRYAAASVVAIASAVSVGCESTAVEMKPVEVNELPQLEEQRDFVGVIMYDPDTTIVGADSLSNKI
jgi:DNA-binding transcriptional regulator YdaS (Cro superfamily)